MINENGLLNIFPTAEASGSIVSFENGADGIPMESLSVAVEPTQDLHGYANPWPAGGGKNLVGLNTSPNRVISYSGVSASDHTDDAVTLTSNGNNTYAQMGLYYDLPAGTYTFSIKATSSDSYTPVVSGYKYVGNVLLFGSCKEGQPKSFTLSETTVVNFRFFATSADSTARTVKFYDVQLESGSTATAWSPYSNICPITGRTGLSVYVGPTQDQQDATTYAVDWTSEAGTVYGGTLDVVTGVLTVDRITDSITKDSVWYGFSTGTGNSSAVVQLAYYQNCKYVAGTSSRNGAISSTGKEAGNYWANARQNEVPGDGDMCFAYSSGGQLRFHRTDVANITDLNAFKAAFPDTQICYYLATPLTYQLTGQEVTTLLGSNRVWSDAGDISLVYHTQADATPSSIDGLFINGEGLQADGWFLKWRKLAAPKPKTDYVSVWGRDGDIDLTESETDGQVFYENRELTMDMVYMGEDWTDAYSELLDMLHGKECAVQFSNDPYWYWAGRIIASLYEHKPHSLTMSGIMFPYKLSVAKVTKSVTVSGAIESNGVEVVLPSSRMRVSPKVTVVAGTGESVTLKWGTKTQTLSAGTYYVRGLKVGSDDVTIKVWGTGTVTFEYRKGML